MRSQRPTELGRGIERFFHEYLPTPRGVPFKRGARSKPIEYIEPQAGDCAR